MKFKFVNNGVLELDEDIISSDTTFDLVDASLLGSITGGLKVAATFDDGTDIEIIYISSVSTNTITCTRGEEGTTATSWTTGQKLECRLTAGTEDSKYVADNLTGTVSVDRFNLGTGASSSTYLRGDGTWDTPPAGGSGTVNSGTAGQIAYYAGTGAAVSGLNPTTFVQVYGTENIIGGSNAGGVLTSGQYNTLLGYRAGYQITSMSDAVAIGTDAVRSATSASIHPVGIGYQALYALTTAAECTAVGYQAGKNITTGQNNTCFGMQSGQSISTGYYNTCIGAQAGASANGNFNVMLGHDTGTTATASECVAIASGAGYGVTGNGCISIGTGYAGRDNSTDCVAIGRYAGAYHTGTNNTFIGRDAGYTAGAVTGNNCVLLGYGSTKSSSSVSNEITLGNSSIATLRCNVIVITSLSDRRDKSDIKPLALGLDFINQLKPVKFTWNSRDGKKVGFDEAGFIAQDLKQVQEDNNVEWLSLVLENNPDRLEASPGKLIPILVKAIQELTKRVEALENAAK